jgi:2-O-methyltransferase
MAKEIHEWIKELLTGCVNPVIVEIGANTGSDTVKLAAIKGAKVHAFEPEPRCDLSKMPANVTVNRKAVSNLNGKAMFNLSDSDGHVWTYSSSLLKPKNHLVAHPHVKFEKQAEVETVKLDDYCRANGIDRIDFLWMDVQVAESLVFEGAEEIVKNTRYIYTEYSDAEMYDGQVPLTKLLEKLRTYEVVELWPKEPSNVLLRNKGIGFAKREMIVRIDDFPTGVRPLVSDMKTFFRIFDYFEKNQMKFFVGFVPKLLKELVDADAKKKLKEYKYLVPLQHGYDHRYFEFSPKLVAAGDPTNRGTIGTFNEFEGKKAWQVNRLVLDGKKYIESVFGRRVNTYIPVCNYVDKAVLTAVGRAGFKNIFSVKGNREVIVKNGNAGIGRGLRQILTEWQGKLANLDEGQYGCIGLHITWEKDYIDENGWEAWTKVFDRHFNNPEPEADRAGKVVEKQVKVAETAELTERDKYGFVSQDFGLIPQVANFYWNLETPLSYLRLLTLATFRYHHPHWKMNLWVSKSDCSQGWKGTEKQDFQVKDETRTDYLRRALDYDVNIVLFDYSITRKLAPNYVSDIARWRTIDGGGWFFDLDQIFVRNFDRLCRNDFVSGGHRTMYCGVLGASKNSEVPEFVNRMQIVRLTGGDKLTGYVEFGNLFVHKLSLTDEWKVKTAGEKHLITESECFYPVAVSKDVDRIYKGEVLLPAGENNFALHWYGGHPKSQAFNRKYTPEFAKESNDSISMYCRGIGVVES